MRELRISKNAPHAAHNCLSATGLVVGDVMLVDLMQIPRQVMVPVYNNTKDAHELTMFKVQYTKAYVLHVRFIVL